MPRSGPTGRASRFGFRAPAWTRPAARFAPDFDFDLVRAPGCTPRRSGLRRPGWSNHIHDWRHSPDGNNPHILVVHGQKFLHKRINRFWLGPITATEPPSSTLEAITLFFSACSLKIASPFKPYFFANLMNFFNTDTFLA